MLLGFDKLSHLPCAKMGYDIYSYCIILYFLAIGYTYFIFFDMKRDDAMKIIRMEAKKRGLDVTINTKAGKGSHAKVTVGARKTTIAAQVNPTMLKVILKQLNLKGGDK